MLPVVDHVDQQFGLLEEDPGHVIVFKEGEDLDSEALPLWMQTPEMKQAMSTLETFSEKDRAYHAYQARQNYLRQQMSIQQELDDRRAEAEQAKQEAEQANRATEQERKSAEQACMALEQERAAKEAALAELERLKAQLHGAAD